MKAIAAAVVAAGLLAAAPTFAADLTDMAKAKGCLACHAVDHKIVGPAYKDVAAKYKGDKAAVAMLAEKVQKGGSGVWGPVQMPPNATVNPAEAKQLVEWVLSLK